MSMIYCTTSEEFYDTVAELTKRGLIFNAYATRLRIELTGGY